MQRRPRQPELKLQLQALTEHEEQAGLANWALDNVMKQPELAFFFAVPNGGHRAIKTALALKQEGVKSGVPDICLPVPRGDYHGLYIEMKVVKGGEMSRPQKAWRAALTILGYCSLRCNGAAEAKEALLAYLALPPHAGWAALTEAQKLAFALTVVPDWAGDVVARVQQRIAILEAAEACACPPRPSPFLSAPEYSSGNTGAFCCLPSERRPMRVKLALCSDGDDFGDGTPPPGSDPVLLDRGRPAFRGRRCACGECGCTEPVREVGALCAECGAVCRGVYLFEGDDEE